MLVPWSSSSILPTARTWAGTKSKILTKKQALPAAEVDSDCRAGSGLAQAKPSQALTGAGRTGGSASRTKET